MLAFIPWFALAMFMLGCRVFGRWQKQSPPKKSVTSSPKLSVSGLRAPPGLLPPKLLAGESPKAEEEGEKKEFEHFGSKLRAARERGATKKLSAPTTKPMSWASVSKPAPMEPKDWDAYLEAKAPGLLREKYGKMQERLTEREEAPTKLTDEMERFLQKKSHEMTPPTPVCEPEIEPPSRDPPKKDGRAMGLGPSKEIQAIWKQEMGSFSASFPVLDSWGVGSSADAFLPPGAGKGGLVPELEFDYTDEAMESAEDLYWSKQEAKGKGKHRQDSWDSWWPEDNTIWEDEQARMWRWGQDGWGENYYEQNHYEAPRKPRPPQKKTNAASRTPDYRATPDTTYRAPELPAATPETNFRTPEVKVWQHGKGRGKGKEKQYVWVEKGTAATGEQSAGEDQWDNWDSSVPVDDQMLEKACRRVIARA